MAGLMRTTLAVLLAGHGLVLSAMAGEPRLWDKEPTLWEAAKKYQISRPLSPVYGWEGPMGMPLPNRKPGEGPLGEGANISNGRMQSSLWGAPERLVLSLAKTDVFNRAGMSFYRGKKPVGQILLLAEDFVGAEQPTVTTTIHDGVNRMNWTQGKARGKVEVFLTDKETNVFVIRGQFANLSKALKLRLYRHKDKFGELPDPLSGDDSGYFWIQQKFAAEKTFPDGFDYYLMGKVVGRPVKVEHASMQPELGAPVPYRDAKNPGTAVTTTLGNAVDFTAYVTVVTRGDASDPLAEAKRRLKIAEQLGFEELRKRNEARYHALYAAREQGRIFTGKFDDAKNFVLPFFYQGAFQSRHIGNSNPDPSRYEGDAAYNSLEWDEVMWSGLQCFNEELYTGDFVAGRDDSVGSYYVKLFNFWRPAWEAHAKSKGLPGLYILRGYVPPLKNDVYWSPDAPAMDGCDWASMIWAFKNVWDSYDYCGKNETFLRDAVYPCLRDIADFFVAKAKLGDDGFYHYEPSQIREEDIGRDAVDCMGAAKWVFKRAIAAAVALNVDADRRAVWQERLAKIKPYYIIKNDRGEPLLASLVKDGNPVVAGHGTTHFLVNVVDEINLESPLELRQMAVRSNLQHHEQPMNRQVEFLLGEARDTLVLGPSASWGSSPFAHPPWMMYYINKTGAIDFANTTLTHATQKTAACWLEPERLCNSRSGTIFLFPTVPGNLDVAFKDFQARGGLLVSAELRAGKVTYAMIKARRNGICAVMNPWPGRKLMIALPSGQAVPVKVENEKYQFQAGAGTSYVLSPQ